MLYCSRRCYCHRHSVVQSHNNVAKCLMAMVYSALPELLLLLLLSHSAFGSFWFAPLPKCTIRSIAELTLYNLFIYLHIETYIGLAVELRQWGIAVTENKNTLRCSVQSPRNSAIGFPFISPQIMNITGNKVHMHDTCAGCWCADSIRAPHKHTLTFTSVRRWNSWIIRLTCILYGFEHCYFELLAVAFPSLVRLYKKSVARLLCQRSGVPSVHITKINSKHVCMRSLARLASWLPLNSNIFPTTSKS